MNLLEEHLLVSDIRIGYETDVHNNGIIVDVCS